MRMCYIILCVLVVIIDSHALVRFLEEDSTSIVPLWRIEDKENLEYGGSCRVVWSNKKVYKAFLICTGMGILNELYISQARNVLTMCSIRCGQ